MQVAKRFKPPTVYWPDMNIITLNKTLNNEQSSKTKKNSAFLCPYCPECPSCPGCSGCQSCSELIIPGLTGKSYRSVVICRYNRKLLIKTQIITLILAINLYPYNRFDLKSRKSISGEQKYYLADLGFYFATNTDKRIYYGPVMENIVFNYARSKGYDVSVGRIGKLECDFILSKSPFNYAYIQVPMTIMSSRETEEREYRPLESIRDNYPKYLLTRNDLIQHRNGIEHFNIAPFMNEDKDF